jgi:hypothetical protein
MHFLYGFPPWFDRWSLSLAEVLTTSRGNDGLSHTILLCVLFYRQPNVVIIQCTVHNHDQGATC